MFLESFAVKHVLSLQASFGTSTLLNHLIKNTSKSRSSNVQRTISTTGFTVWDSTLKKNVPLTTQYPHILSWYSCGPTVYDSAHIGHASSYIRQDVIRRILENFDGRLSVIQLMGVTDIDDKIINKSNQLKVPWESICKKYEMEFFEDLVNLNVKLPQIRTNVTQFIPQIVSFVGDLINKGSAYVVSDGSVYFDTKKFENYGKFQKLSESTEVEEGQEKKNSKDFAVWKGWKPGEPFWLTPWGKGRPGWHIECSAMASHYFNSKLDLHTGGIDLRFPHHENEEAQCCAKFDVDKWVSHWLHTGHLIVKGDEKMSKSIGNTITIRDFIHNNSQQSFRMLCILSKYQNNLEYSSESLYHAKSMLKKFETFISDTEAILHGTKIVQQSANDNAWEKLIRARENVQSSLKNDFNTPSAIQSISEFIDFFNLCVISKESSQSFAASDYGFVLGSSDFVKNFLSLVGIRSNKTQSESNSGDLLLESVLSEFVQFRTQVRNYALAVDEVDKITRKEKIAQRKELLDSCDDVRIKLGDLGVTVKDHGKTSSLSRSIMEK